jgi:tellurite resistance protein TehA-like permease
MTSAPISRLFAVMPTTSWTIVMTCGVVSIDLSSDHEPVLSAIMFWFAAAVWVVLMAALGVPLVLQRGRLWRESASPAVLTIVAATAVLGSRIVVAGHRTVAVVLLALAATEWAVLTGPVVRRWVTPTHGISFVLAVAAEAVALLSASLAVPYGSRWLCCAALVLVVVGLGLYGFTAARFDLGQLRSGRGDHWIVGGSLAIAALSAARTTQAADRLGLFTDVHEALKVGTLVVWGASMVWLLVLVAGEIAWPRPTYSLARWATAFPIGMYSACSLATGKVTGISGIVTFAQVWTWVALAATVLLLAGLFAGWSHVVRRAARRETSALTGGSL